MKHRLSLISWTLCLYLAASSTPLAGGGLQQGELLIARNRNSELKRYSGTSGAFIGDFIPDTGGLHAAFDSRMGPDGNIYVANYDGGRITRYHGTTGAFMNVVVPHGSGGLERPLQVAVAPNGDVFVVSFSATLSSNQILRFDAAGTPLGSATLGSARSLAFAPDGQLLVGTQSGTSSGVRKFDADSLADLGDFIAPGGALPGPPWDLHSRPDGYLYISHGSNTTSSLRGVSRFDPDSGAFVDAFITSAPSGNGKMDFSASGDLFICNPQTNDVRKYNGIDGTYLGVFITLGSGPPFNPNRPLFLEDGSLLLVKSYWGAHRHDGNTGDLLGVFIPEGFNDHLVGPTDFALSGDGSSLFIADQQFAIRRFDRFSGTFVEDTIALLSLPSPIGRFALGSNGDFYAVAYSSNSIQRFDDDGSNLGAFVASGSGTLNQPLDVTFGPDGHLYVISAGNDKVLKYNGTSGSFLGEFVTSGSGGLTAPDSIAFGPDGDLYVSDFQSDSVLRYDGQTGQFLGAFVTPGSGGLDGPKAFSFAPGGNLFVASSTNAVLEYDGQTGSFVGEFVPPQGAPGDTRALLFVKEATVPAVSTWGLIVLSLFIATVGTAMLRWRSLNGSTT